MPRRDFEFEACGVHQERYYCVDALTLTCKCGQPLTMLERSDEGSRRIKSKMGAFPFTTNHIDSQGRPMTIESLGHLRQVERDYGVVLSAFSQEPSNLDPIKNPPTYRGGLPREQR
jgi:hypothetical protein